MMAWALRVLPARACFEPCMRTFYWTISASACFVSSSRSLDISIFCVITLRHFAPSRVVYVTWVWNGKCVTVAMSKFSILSNSEMGFIPYSKVNIESVVTFPNRRERIVLLSVKSVSSSFLNYRPLWSLTLASTLVAMAFYERIEAKSPWSSWGLTCSI